MDHSVQEQLDRALRDVRLWRTKTDILEKENNSLKNSIFELSIRYNVLAHLQQSKPFFIPSSVVSIDHHKSNEILNIVQSGSLASTLINSPQTPSAIVPNPSSLLLSYNEQQQKNYKDTHAELNSLSQKELNALVSDTTSPSSLSSIATSILPRSSGLPEPYGHSPPKGFEAFKSKKTLITVSTLPDSTSTNKIRDNKDSKHFVLKSDLKGHVGAVYTVEFSKCGRFLASGSIDKTIRVWDMTSSPKELHVLKRHQLSVSEICWSSSSREILSCSFDQTCRTWDTELGKHVGTYRCDGFVQCAQFSLSPVDSSNIFVYGTSHKVLGVVDRRQPSDCVLSVITNSMVNSVYVYRDGSLVLAADSMGVLTVWDMRKLSIPVSTMENDSFHKQISHIAVTKSEDDEEPRYMAINSFDNVVRVYDRGFTPPRSQTTLLHSLSGHKNKSWPIRSSFYSGQEFLTESSSVIPKTDHEIDSTTSISECVPPEQPIMLLATGSADPFVYIYAMGNSSGHNDMIQRLEGHSDRVYDVSFHPTEPILASCSADFTVKLWSTIGRGRRIISL